MAIINNKTYDTLFLDRDGVINVERKNDYAKNISEFLFIDGTLDALSILSSKFSNIIIVTNQRGVGRGIMSESDLESVHNYMLQQIEEHSGKISGIYVCTDLYPISINRKPNIGMAFKALEKFPQIDFTKSIMVGNSRSDIDFGQKLGMYTILVGDKYPKSDAVFNNINAYFPNLYQFSLSL
ncbi:HAD-IIIA family hydrolase [Dysgonomonas sp. 216]|uniref:D-glycero-alpha-D-manno-heptose-1,7-bisphosphate 7-phosphatase n=1 Tax=Dysgonomonas sp. 216 TaxID=2302934 RepID=UPI0013D1BDD4|nr:HAD-IIIA family hydrolase [Dysgonomonas sp. 216]NDW18066.1 HAD-IIIA family hydrolase [Dysgonomonas sp. 216]